MDQNPQYSNGWKTKEAFVLHALERHDDNFDKIFSSLEKMSIDIAIIKSRGMMYTLVAGAMPALAALAMLLLQIYLK